MLFCIYLPESFCDRTIESFIACLVIQCKYAHFRGGNIFLADNRRGESFFYRAAWLDFFCWWHESEKNFAVGIQMKTCFSRMQPGEKNLYFDSRWVKKYFFPISKFYLICCIPYILGFTKNLEYNSGKNWVKTRAKDDKSVHY